MRVREPRGSHPVDNMYAIIAPPSSTTRIATPMMSLSSLPTFANTPHPCLNADARDESYSAGDRSWNSVVMSMAELIERKTGHDW